MQEIPESGRPANAATERNRLDAAGFFGDRVLDQAERLEITVKGNHLEHRKRFKKDPSPHRVPR